MSVAAGEAQSKVSKCKEGGEKRLATRIAKVKTPVKILDETI